MAYEGNTAKFAIEEKFDVGGKSGICQAKTTNNEKTKIKMKLLVKLHIVGTRS